MLIIVEFLDKMLSWKHFIKFLSPEGGAAALPPEAALAKGLLKVSSGYNPETLSNPGRRTATRHMIML